MSLIVLQVFHEELVNTSVLYERLFDMIVYIGEFGGVSPNWGQCPDTNNMSPLADQLLRQQTITLCDQTLDSFFEDG